MVVGAFALVIKRDAVLGVIEQMNTTGIPLSAAALVCVVLSVISALNLGLGAVRVAGGQKPLDREEFARCGRSMF